MLGSGSEEEEEDAGLGLPEAGESGFGCGGLCDLLGLGEGEAVETETADVEEIATGEAVTELSSRSEQSEHWQLLTVQGTH